MRYDLYIRGELCDLDDQSLVVLTYTMEQLTNPTAVKNTYSHSVELPSTERNNKIFAHYYRNDYSSELIYSPLEQLPFSIYNELGEIVEQGYAKLDEVSNDKGKHKYKITLYGGLGSFFYAMANNENGEALTLGDLQYLANLSDASREELLNLRINRTTLAFAWARLQGNNAYSQYDVINFAPTYQGMPEGDFDANKALFIGNSPSGGAVPANPIYGISPQGTNTYFKRYNGNGEDTNYRISLVEFSKDLTEWEVKDLRTYLQRPVLSIKKFVEAVQRRATSLGYNLRLDARFFNEANPYYGKAWMTLPSLQSITHNKKEAHIAISGKVQINSSAVQVINLTASMPSDLTYEFGATINSATIKLEAPFVKLERFAVNPLWGEYNRYSFCRDIYSGVAWFVQVYGMTSGGGSLVAYSDVKMLTSTSKYTPEAVASGAKYTPKGANPKYSLVDGFFNIYDKENGVVQFSQGLEFDITTLNVADDTEWVLRIDKVALPNGTSPVSVGALYGSDGGSPKWIDIVASPTTLLQGTAAISTNENVRSNAIVTKRELLDIGKTPLDVLLSYCKLFGLVWQYAPQSNEVSVEMKPTFYSSGEVVDWEDRIDRSKAMTTTPFVFDKRFYDFELESKGQWAEEYAEKFGTTYGSQRVNTGYNFDSDKKNLLEGSALKGGAEVLEMSKFYCNISEGGKVCPSAFLEKCKYQMYDTNGNATEYDALTPSVNASIDYLNELPGYDFLPKLQLHKDRKLNGEGGTLLFYVGGEEVTEESPYKSFRLTDDTADMGLLNDGVPCWVLEGSVYGSLEGEYIPQFVRVGHTLSLNMGIPQEIDNPHPDMVAERNTIYSQYWAKYIADRYDKDSRVLSCYVDMRGIQVNSSLFRNIYWFDNAMWALNKISNYSMTTEGTTQCEFVKIQDVVNYKG